MVQEFAGNKEADADSDTIELDWYEQEARTEAEALRREQRPPKAFETSIATQESIRLNRAAQSEEYAPAAWRNKGGREASRGGTLGEVATKGERGKEGGLGMELVAAAVLGRRGRQSGWGPPAAGAEEGRKSRSRSSVRKGSALEEQEGAAGSEDLLQMQGEAMEWRGDPRGAKRGRSRGPQRKQSSETEEDATQQGHEHCLACGDGPFPPTMLREKCSCGGPICGQCMGASSCMRCNGGEKAQQQVLG